MKLIKRILAVMLVLCMALSLAGCGDTTWICEVDGDTVAAGLYIYYQNEGYGDALYNLVREDSDNYLMYYIYYYNYGYVEPQLFEVSLSSGKTVEEYINNYALDMCKQAVIIDKLFTELGLEFTAEEQALIDTQVRSAWANAQASWEAAGVSEASFKAALVANYKEDKVFDAYYEVGGRNGTTEAEVQDYFAENYARVKYMTFTFSDSVDDAIDEARKSEQLDLANEYLTSAQSGTPMNELIEQYNEYLASLKTEEDTDEDTTEPEAENEVEAEPDEYANESILSKESTYPTEKFVNYVFTTVKVGEFSVIQDDTCFYLVERLDVRERTDLYDTYRASIMEKLFDSDFTKLINTELAKYTVNVNEKSVKRYTVKQTFKDAYTD